ncbi:response regulator transcription factor [Cetobacterium sp. SF1]|uniref:response regulator transcription factor n=1 Tax=unclassified Cetobacterium TaxID=2630983 RepID=UPI003CF4DB5E
MKKILIIEDEDLLRDILRRYLEKEGYSVTEASTGEMGLEKFSEDNFSLVLLDIMLPGIQGWDVFNEIKNTSVPVIMLTACGDEEDEVKGLELGAHDYVTKPFKPKVLMTRIESILKRKSKVSFLEKIGDLEIDEKNYSVRKNGQELNLGNKGFALLMYFILNKNLVLTREQILNSIWPTDFNVDSRVVDTQVKLLRKQVGENYIKTIRGIGYKFQESDL